MALTPDDIVVAIKILADSKEAVASVNAATTAVKQYIKAAETANAVSRATGGKALPIATAGEVEQVKTLGKAIGEIEPATGRATKGLWSLRNMARTALGTFEAMAIFFITQFVAKAITKAIEGVKQLELALYNLGVAEKAISLSGVDITPQDFKDIIQSVKDLNLAISNIDITKSVGDLAIGLKELGLSKKQLEELAKAAAITSLSKNLNMSEVVAQYVGGIAKGGKGLADLDIQVDAAVIKQKALDAQLVESEEAWNNLTAAQRQSVETQALYLIIIEDAKLKQEELDKLNGSMTTTTKEASAAWEDFTAQLGQLIAPTVTYVLRGILDQLDTFKDALEKTKLSMADFSSAFAASFTFTTALQMGKNPLQAFLDAKDAFEKAQEYNKNLNNAQDTPTGTPTIGEGIEPDKSLQEALDKMNKEILEANIRLEQDLEDVTIDLERKRQDILLEYANKRLDIERDYANKVVDINRTYDEKISDINDKAAEARQKHRNDEMEREREFQNKMQEMKEEFLMDLEDALHSRDARQILKLIRQYELEKLQAERKYELDKENADRDESLRQQTINKEKKEAEEDRKRKLAEAQQDYQDKLAKLAADQLAEEDAARLAVLRKIEDLNKNNADRLAVIAANLVQEYNLTQEGLNAILSLYQQYYTDISAIYSAMQSMMSGMGVGQRATPSYTASGVTRGHEDTGHGGFAEGGMVLANKPTTATFGEAGLELATFTPLNRNGTDVNKLFSNMNGSGGSGSGGQVQIELLLSPDLESRIVKNTLSRTGEIITKVRRTK